MLQDQHDKVSN